MGGARRPVSGCLDWSPSDTPFPLAWTRPSPLQGHADKPFPLTRTPFTVISLILQGHSSHSPLTRQFPPRRRDEWRDRGWGDDPYEEHGPWHLVRLFFFFCTPSTDPRRSLGLNLNDTRVYEPQIRARPGTWYSLALLYHGFQTKMILFILVGLDPNCKTTSRIFGIKPGILTP
jgi:hypothetical protein